MKKDNDVIIVDEMFVYFNNIDRAIKRFGNNQKIFDTDTDYKNSVFMSLFWIGELAKNFSSAYLERSEVNWDYFIELGDVIITEPDSLDISEIWQVLTNQIPKVRRSCRVSTSKKIMNQQ